MGSVRAELAKRWGSGLKKNVKEPEIQHGVLSPRNKKGGGLFRDGSVTTDVASCFHPLVNLVAS